MCACNYINFIPVFPCHCLSAVHYSISYYWEKHVNIPCVCVCLCISSSVMSDYLWPHGLQPTRLLCSWNSLEWVAISFSRESSRPRDQTWVSCIAGSLLHCWWILLPTEPPGKWVLILYSATLLNSLMSCTSFLVASLGFSMYSILSANNDSFTSSFPVRFLFFFLLWLPWLGLSILCWIKVVRVSILILDENACSWS